MRYHPRIGESLEVEATTIEIEDELRLKGEHVRYNDKGEIAYLTRYYAIKIKVSYSQ
jgi:hypothetical protein